MARRLTENLQVKQAALAKKLAGIDPEVAEAAALAHDLGHPPFGHVAERELDQLISRDCGLPDGFEGNAQTFRVLTKLSVRYPDYQGQNLTRATLNAVLKYPWFRATDGFRHRKFGVYGGEREDFNWARALNIGKSSDVKSPEAEIMDWADDIAYAVHDAEDFYRAGFVPLDRLMDEDSDELEKFIAGTFRRWELESFRPIRDTVSNAQLKDSFLNLMGQLRETQRITEPYYGTREQRANLRGLTSLLIGRYVPAIQLRSLDRKSARTVDIQPEAEREISMLKQLTWYYVIQRPSLAGQQYGQRRVIRELFGVFLDATASQAKRSILPPTQRGMLEQWLESPQGADEMEIRARTAADAVCSLSEQQAIALHQRVTGVDPGSVLYSILP